MNSDANAMSAMTTALLASFCKMISPLVHFRKARDG
jgi:hypothetical protein